MPINIEFADRHKYYDSFDHYYGNDKSVDTLTALIAAYEVEELEKHIAAIEG